MPRRTPPQKSATRRRGSSSHLTCVVVVDGDVAHTAVLSGESNDRQATTPATGVDVARHLGLAVCEIGHLDSEHQEVAILTRVVQRAGLHLHTLTAALRSNEPGQRRAGTHEHYVLPVFACLRARPVDALLYPRHILLPSRVSASALQHNLNCS